VATTIGYLGPKGTFTKLAVDKAFNGDRKHSFATIPECIDAVEAEKNRYWCCAAGKCD
jgi:prephenate dehydratase